MLDLLTGGLCTGRVVSCDLASPARYSVCCGVGEAFFAHVKIFEVLDLA
jgi:hypothetical protein